MNHIKLIYKTFNLFNGIINKINTGIDIIIKNDLDCYGTLYLRSTIYINLEKLIKDSPNDIAINTNIVYTIIHELYHADQYLNDYLYLSDNEYRDLKEAEVIYRAVTYILIHQKEIEDKLNIKMDRQIIFSNREYLDEIYGINNISDFCRYELQDCIIKNIIGLTRNTDISWTNHYRVKIKVKNDFEEETHWIKNGLYSEYTPQVLQYLINKYSKPYSLNQQSISSFKTIEDDILVINVIFKEENNNIQTGIVWDNKD